MQQARAKSTGPRGGAGSVSCTVCRPTPRMVRRQQTASLAAVRVRLPNQIACWPTGSNSKPTPACSSPSPSPRSRLGPGETLSPVRKLAACKLPHAAPTPTSPLPTLKSGLNRPTPCWNPSRPLARDHVPARCDTRVHCVQGTAGPPEPEVSACEGRRRCSALRRPRGRAGSCNSPGVWNRSRVERNGTERPAVL